MDKKSLIAVVILIISIGVVYVHKTKGEVPKIFSSSSANKFPTDDPGWEKNAVK